MIGFRSEDNEQRTKLKKSTSFQKKSTGILQIMFPKLRNRSLSSTAELKILEKETSPVSKEEQEDFTIIKIEEPTLQVMDTSKFPNNLLNDQVSNHKGIHFQVENYFKVNF
jgi:hypothetical protein